MNKENKILEDQAWASMHELLDAEMPQKKKRTPFLIWCFSLGCLVVASAIFAYAFIGEKKYTQQNNDVQSFIYAQTNEGVEKSDLSDKSIEDQTQKHIVVKDVVVKDEALEYKGVSNENNSTTDNDKLPAEGNTTIGKTNTINNIKGTKSKSVTNEYVNYDIDQNSIQYLNTTSEIIKFHVSDNVGINSDEVLNNNSLSIKQGDTIEVNSMKEESINNISNYESVISIALIPSRNIEIESLNIYKVLNILRIIPSTVTQLSYAIDNGHSTLSCGLFSSFQYLDSSFNGFDLGVQIAYRKGRWLTNYKIGFENLSNRDDQVLSDSRIGVIALEPEDIFTNSANAGLDLDDIILDKRSLILEATIGYDIGHRLSLSSGLGYKRLIQTNTRSIFGLTPDNQSGFGDDASLGDIELNVFDNSTLLNDPTVNRNRWYMPVEVSYNVMSNINVGIGSQFFLNSSFAEFEEINNSFYARLSYHFQ